MAGDGPQSGADMDGFIEGGQSWLRGTKDPELCERTIPEVFADTVNRFGDRPALILPGLEFRLSWWELDDRVGNLAAGLHAIGLRKGDRIGIWSPNCIEWVLVQFATARLGLILVNINPAYRRAELEFALSRTGCRALITAERFKSSDYLGMLREMILDTAGETFDGIYTDDLPELRHVISISDAPRPDFTWFSDLCQPALASERAEIDARAASLHPDEPINIQFTSGTTGSPKGATLTHRNIVNNARFVTDRIRLTEADRLCIPVPLYHCFGMAMGTLGCVTKGAAMVLCGPAFDADDTLQALVEAKATGLYAVPTMFVAMLDRIREEHHDLSALRTGIMAGAPCPIEVMRRVISEMNMREVTICYGMTETAPVSFQSHTDDPVEKRVTTVGRIHPHVEVRLVGRDGGVVAVGERGELCTRGYSVMQGYWNDPDRTRQSIRDGWMHTGDLAVFDEAGYCRIVGRVKDMIIRGGENIFPREIEDFIFRHPDVREVQVFGIPDERLGEVVCAWIIGAEGAGLSDGEIRRFCDGNIAHFKIPAHIRIVDNMPMTVTGKPQKFRMREQMIRMLQDEEG